MRELFDSVGTVSSSSPDQFTSVSGGPYYSRVVGPYVSPDVAPGWSADNQGQSIIGTFAISSGVGMAAQTNGVAGVWIRFKSFQNTGTAIPLDLRSLTGGGHSSVQFTIDTSGNLTAVVYGGSTSVGPTLSLDTWYYMAVAWYTTASNTFTFQMYSVPTGSTGTFTPFATQTGVNQLNKIQQVNFGSNSNSIWEGRLGAPGLYSISSLSDVAYPSDLNIPVEARHTWVIDPINGNDNNTGLLGSPWKTVAKFDTESLYSGLMDTAAGYNNGDKLIIDTTNGSLPLTTQPLQILTRGLNITSASGQQWAVLQPWVTIPNNSFTKTVGYTNIYQTSSTTMNSVVWENDIWENHPTGANFSAVASTLDSTPGSFWTDGTTMYIHPFGNTNPITDGKVYTRSTYFSSYSTSDGVQLLAPDISISNIYVRKTSAVSPTSNASNYGYGITGTSGFGGTSLIDNSYADYCGEHCIGFTDNASSSNVTISNDEAEQTIPYVGGTDFVSYNGSSNTGNIHNYINDTVRAGVGVIGSSVGTTTAEEVFVSHNNGGSGQFASINFQNGYFPFGNITVGGADNVVTVSSSTVGSISNSTVLNVTGTIFNDQFVNGIGTMSVTNSTITPTSNINSGWLGNVSGTLTVTNNTIDLSGIGGSTVATAPILTRNGALAFTFQNNIITIPSSKSYTIIGSSTNSDMLNFSNNTYHFGTGTYVANQYNDGSTTADRTFAQWQALGFDAGSVDSAPQSPTIGIPTALSTTSIRWNFTDNATNETGFKVYDNLGNIATSSAATNLTHLDETGLSANTQYTGRYVLAYNTYGASASSSVASSIYTLAPTPTNLVATPGQTTMALSVDALANATAGSSGYLFTNNTNSDTSGLIQTNSWNDSSLTCGTSYSYSVIYQNGDGATTSPISLTQSTSACSVSSGGGGGGGGGGGSYYTAPTPTPTPAPAPTTPTSSSLSFPTFDSIRLVNNNGTYYLIQNGQRQGVTSPGILFSYGFEFKDATQATAADLALPQGGLLLPSGGALVKSVQDKTVYLITDGQRHAFISSRIFTGLGFKFSTVLLVTNPELQALPKGANLSNSTAAHMNGLNVSYKGTIYFIGSNVRHPYPSIAVYNSWNLDNDFSRVIPANAADLKLPIGDPVISRVLQ